jgi:hypothetical protein
VRRVERMAERWAVKSGAMTAGMKDERLVGRRAEKKDRKTDIGKGNWMVD